MHSYCNENNTNTEGVKIKDTSYEIECQFFIILSIVAFTLTLVVITAFISYVVITKLRTKIRNHTSNQTSAPSCSYLAGELNSHLIATAGNLDHNQSHRQTAHNAEFHSGSVKSKNSYRGGSKLYQGISIENLHHLAVYNSIPCKNTGYVYEQQRQNQADEYKYVTNKGTQTGNGVLKLNKLFVNSATEKKNKVRKDSYTHRVNPNQTCCDITLKTLKLNNNDSEDVKNEKPRNVPIRNKRITATINTTRCHERIFSSIDGEHYRSYTGSLGNLKRTKSKTLKRRSFKIERKQPKRRRSLNTSLMANADKAMATVLSLSELSVDIRSCPNTPLMSRPDKWGRKPNKLDKSALFKLNPGQKKDKRFLQDNNYIKKCGFKLPEYKLHDNSLTSSEPNVRDTVPSESRTRALNYLAKSDWCMYVPEHEWEDQTVF